jgi:outer membrane protein assembly factor BamB
MAIAHTNEMTARKPLRLWPGVVIVLVQCLIRFVIPAVAPDAQFFGVGAQIVGVLAGPVGLLAVLVWWLFFSRARWSERLSAIVVMIVAIVVTRPLTHQSIQNGMMGMMFFLYAVPPTLSLAFVLWAVASRRLSDGPRRAAMVAAILIGCGVWMLARTNGILGGVADLEWRWTPTAEERLLAQAAEPLAVPSAEATAAAPREPAALPPAAVAVETPTAAVETPKELPVAKADKAENKPATPAAVETAAGSPAMSERGSARVEWPGFRGPGRDSIVRGVRIETDWAKSPPVALWRRPIGPGWSSFAVRSDLLYTQEQRGDDEIVACYNLTTGKPVWMHRDATRFWESNGGAGPRATPALSGGRVYAFGATGILNALDAGNGAVVWSHNAASDNDVKVPGWGFAGSPLVVGDVVIVAASGALVAYDVATGDRRWFVKSTGGSYSSPQLVTIDGIAQILLMGGAGTKSVAPADGKVLWENAWPGAPMVQPAVIAGGDLLITTADAMGGLGTRRIAVGHGGSGWTVEERWTSRALKPYFNDFVVHKGHAYGFDGAILACINLADGTRTWKGGRYGNGQLVLLADQDLLLVLSEEGELALVSATPDQFTELARIPALNSKTWNHPVLVGDVLLVRNGEEMAAFRLSLAGRADGQPSR